ncbi:hypothetical protein AX15_004593 [Amanita polypyramis BW_CC]|nr:hypothetical protein AX15_004593 [Amanita polypyramis BW_CC]
MLASEILANGILVYDEPSQLTALTVVILAHPAQTHFTAKGLSNGILAVVNEGSNILSVFTPQFRLEENSQPRLHLTTRVTDFVHRIVGLSPVLGVDKTKGSTNIPNTPPDTWT